MTSALPLRLLCVQAFPSREDDIPYTSTIDTVTNSLLKDQPMNALSPHYLFSILSVLLSTAVSVSMLLQVGDNAGMGPVASVIAMILMATVLVYCHFLFWHKVCHFPLHSSIHSRFDACPDVTGQAATHCNPHTICVHPPQHP